MAKQKSPQKQDDITAIHINWTLPFRYRNPDWDWYEDPCNTALVYFGNQTFLQEYTRAAIDFMIDNNERPSEMNSTINI